MAKPVTEPSSDSAENPVDLIVARSPFNDQVGYRLVAWEPDFARLEIDIEHRHLNRGGAVHGGVLMTIIDSAGGYCGTYCPHPGRTRLCVTATLSTEFLRPGPANSRLTVEARRRGGGRGIFTATMEVTDDRGRLVALGHGIYRYIRGSGDPDGIPGRDSTDIGDADSADAKG